MPRKRQALVTTLRVLGVLSALILLWATFRDASWLRVRALLGSVGPAFLLVLLPQGFALAAESLGWRRAFAAIGQPVSFWPLLRVRVATEALAQSLPVGMLWCESIKPYLLRRHCGISIARSIAGMAARKYLLLLSQAASLLLAFAVGWTALGRASESLLGGAGLRWCVLAGAIVLGLAATAMASGFQHGELAVRSLAILKRLPLERWRQGLDRRAAQFLQTDDEVGRFFRTSWQKRGAAAVFFLGVWLLEASETFVILRVLDVDLPWSAALAMEVIVVLLRHLLVMMPAGLGVQDLGYVALLAALGVPDAISVGAAFSLIKRSKEALWSMVGWSLLAIDRPGRERIGPLPAAVGMEAP